MSLLQLLLGARPDSMTGWLTVSVVWLLVASGPINLAMFVLQRVTWGWKSWLLGFCALLPALGFMLAVILPMSSEKSSAAPIALTCFLANLGALPFQMVLWSVRTGADRRTGSIWPGTALAAVGATLLWAVMRPVM